MLALGSSPIRFAVEFHVELGRGRLTGRARRVHFREPARPKLLGIVSAPAGFTELVLERSGHLGDARPWGGSRGGSPANALRSAALSPACCGGIPPIADRDGFPLGSITAFVLNQALGAEAHGACGTLGPLPGALPAVSFPGWSRRRPASKSFCRPPFAVALVSLTAGLSIAHAIAAQNRDSPEKQASAGLADAFGSLDRACPANLSAMRGRSRGPASATPVRRAMAAGRRLCKRRRRDIRNESRAGAGRAGGRACAQARALGGRAAW